MPYKIAFTGGELTTNKNFLPFVNWLRTNYNKDIFKLLLTTNGSATYKYYSKLFEVLDNISFSIHSEFFDEKKFFDLVVKLKKAISNDKFIRVEIMNEYWNQERIPKYIELLNANEISYSLNKITYKYQTRTYPIMQGKLNLDI